MNNNQNKSGTGNDELKKIVVIGPVYPFKGGIAHYTGLLVRSLRKKYDVEAVSYKMQYPKIMFKKEQRDYSNKTFAIDDAKFWINTANPFNIIGVAGKIKKMKPDLVIISWWHPYFAPCYQILASFLGKCKIAYLCHNVLPHERFPFDKALSKGTLKKADFCIVHSEEDKADLAGILPGMVCKKNMHPTYNAFRINDISREDARRQLNISDNEKVILFFGLVRKYKGLMHLLNAMPAIIKNVPDIKLFIVGDFGDDKAEYISKIEELKIGENIVIRDGYVPDDEVEPYFAAADLNVCPYESATQSGILQIAFGFGLPAVVTRVGGLPEVVTDGETGYVVPPLDPASLADAISDYFMNSKEDYMRTKVEEDSYRFSWDRMTETVEELWEKVR